jgi:hypothetical protein
MDVGNLSAVSKDMIDDALTAFIVEQTTVVNERMRMLLSFGEYKSKANRAGITGAIVEKVDLDRVETALNRLTLLISTCRSIIWLMTAPESRGILHFPVLRAKLPYAMALVLSLVGAEQTTLDTEGTLTLAAFAEFYVYLRGWKEAIQ